MYLITGRCRLAGSGEIPPDRRLVQVSIWRPGQVGSTGIAHPWRTIFKGNIWISRDSHTLDFLLYLLFCCETVLNKYVQLLERRLLPSQCRSDCEVTQPFRTGVIPLRDTPTTRGPHNVPISYFEYVKLLRIMTVTREKTTITKNRMPRTTTIQSYITKECNNQKIASTLTAYEGRWTAMVIPTSPYLVSNLIPPWNVYEKRLLFKQLRACKEKLERLKSLFNKLISINRWDLHQKESLLFNQLRAVLFPI